MFTKYANSTTEIYKMYIFEVGKIGGRFNHGYDVSLYAVSNYFRFCFMVDCCRNRSRIQKWMLCRIFVLNLKMYAS